MDPLPPDRRRWPKPLREQIRSLESAAYDAGRDAGERLAHGLPGTIGKWSHELRRQIDRLCDAAWEEGRAVGAETATRVLRDEIRDELKDELESFDPECPLCIARRDIADLRRQLESAQSNLNLSRARARGWAMREGRHRYRET